jgi:hypothetical protein
MESQIFHKMKFELLCAMNESIINLALLTIIKGELIFVIYICIYMCVYIYIYIQIEYIY